LIEVLTGRLISPHPSNFSKWSVNLWFYTVIEIDSTKNEGS
jgi:hypothetical protein